MLKSVLGILSNALPITVKGWDEASNVSKV